MRLGSDDSVDSSRGDEAAEAAAVQPDGDGDDDCDAENESGPAAPMRRGPAPTGTGAPPTSIPAGNDEVHRLDLHSARDAIRQCAADITERPDVVGFMTGAGTETPVNDGSRRSAPTAIAKLAEDYRVQTFTTNITSQAKLMNPNIHMAAGSITSRVCGRNKADAVIDLLDDTPCYAPRQRHETAAVLTGRETDEFIEAFQRVTTQAAAPVTHMVILGFSGIRRSCSRRTTQFLHKVKLDRLTYVDREAHQHVRHVIATCFETRPTKVYAIQADAHDFADELAAALNWDDQWRVHWWDLHLNKPGVLDKYDRAAVVLNELEGNAINQHEFGLGLTPTDELRKGTIECYSQILLEHAAKCRREQVADMRIGAPPAPELTDDLDPPTTARDAAPKRPTIRRIPSLKSIPAWLVVMLSMLHRSGAAGAPLPASALLLSNEWGTTACPARKPCHAFAAASARFERPRGLWRRCLRRARRTQAQAVFL